MSCLGDAWCHGNVGWTLSRIQPSFQLSFISSSFYSQVQTEMQKEALRLLFPSTRASSSFWGCSSSASPSPELSLPGRIDGDSSPRLCGFSDFFLKLGFVRGLYPLSLMTI